MEEAAERSQGTTSIAVARRWPPADLNCPALDFSETMEGSLANTQETAGSPVNQNPAGGVYPH